MVRGISLLLTLFCFCSHNIRQSTPVPSTAPRQGRTPSARSASWWVANQRVASCWRPPPRAAVEPVGDRMIDDGGWRGPTCVELALPESWKLGSWPCSTPTTTPLLYSNYSWNLVNGFPYTKLGSRPCSSPTTTVYQVLCLVSSQVAGTACIV